eukprot:c39393_g1_i1 orf=1-171(-)
MAHLSCQAFISILLALLAAVQAYVLHRHCARLEALLVLRLAYRSPRTSNSSSHAPSP